MKKRLFIFIFFLCISVVRGIAQLSPQFSQYMEVPSAINPASIARDEMMSVFGVYRLQWAGYSGAPKDMMFSFTMPLKIGDTKHGLGLYFFSDEIGLFKNQSVLLQYSYKLRVLKGVLSLGLNVGFINQTFDKDEVDFVGAGGEEMSGDEYHESDDPILKEFTASESNDVAFDVSFGCEYSQDEFYVGLSVLHLNAARFNYGSDVYELYMPRIFSLTGAYELQTHKSDLIFIPSAQLRTNFSSWQCELTGLFEYSKRVRGGISYRFGDAFVFLFGVDIINGLRLCYSYDLPTSKMIRSGGSHEVSLRYSFKPQFAKKNKYKSDRIL
ncbi:MAG: type IX secretion system membrane protein PorP/SprF [Paludibacteraceae bacterium]|jgi:type IX secretion system PorP/SprF family membrane protein|nr:type IX secretion system membrane protein PorP/SprF [Paludibacteraceae bacterium]